MLIRVSSVAVFFRRYKQPIILVVSSMKIVHYPHPALRHPGKAVMTIDKELRLQIGQMMD